MAGPDLLTPVTHPHPWALGWGASWAPSRAPSLGSFLGPFLGPLLGPFLGPIRGTRLRVHLHPRVGCGGGGGRQYPLASKTAVRYLLPFQEAPRQATRSHFGPSQFWVCGRIHNITSPSEYAQILNKPNFWRGFARLRISVSRLKRNGYGFPWNKGAPFCVGLQMENTKRRSFRLGNSPRLPDDLRLLCGALRGRAQGPTTFRADR